MTNDLKMADDLKMTGDLKRTLKWPQKLIKDKNDPMIFLLFWL